MTIRGITLIFLLGLFGCSAEVGDACSSDVDCGQGRVCDRSSRGGYCTVSPCAPGTCPDNSVCVEFENKESYCMALCDSDGDCRSGYRCDDETGAAPYCRQNEE